MGRANQERRRAKEKARRQAAARSTGRPGSHQPSHQPGSHQPSHQPGSHQAGSHQPGSHEPGSHQPGSHEPGCPQAGAAFTAGGAASSGPWAPDATEQVRGHLTQALGYLALDDPAHFGVVLGRLLQAPEGQDAAWRRIIERDLGSLVTTRVTELWQTGWEPADVVRAIGRSPGGEHAGLARDAIAAEISGYARTTVAPRWLDQLAELEATVRWPRERGWLTASEDRPWPRTLRLALELAHELARLPRLERLGPIPGAATHAPRPDRPDVDERVLARVRALLAKAESTNYPAEAETFTAGAQALMARHRIDRALLEATLPQQAAGPEARRIGIDNPYEAPKTMLLDAVASANQCRVIWTKYLGFCTVIGHATDLDAVELLFTSLLVQATGEMTRQGSRKDPYGRSRTRAFRQSFLTSYSRRIRERLEETTHAQTCQAVAETGRSDLLPVLASRRRVVDDATDMLFPHLVQRSVSSSHDAEGWIRGRAAADLADLRAAQPVTAS
jgi:hypothetical protein